MLDILSINRKVLVDKWRKTIAMEEWQFSSCHKITWKMEVVISRENYSTSNGVKSVKERQEQNISFRKGEIRGANLNISPNI